jgi:His-Xaa-Ser system protein HxsD
MKSNSKAIQFDLNLFDADSIERAALKFSGACHHEFRIDGAMLIVLACSAEQGVDVDLDEYAHKLRAEVLDQQLRKRIAAETENERNLILAYAFSNTKLIRS